MSALPKPIESEFHVVAPKDIEGMWPLVENGIARALATSNGEGTVEDTKKGLLAGRTKLMVLWEGDSVLGAVFMLLDFPRYRIARVLLLFGQGMEALREVMESGEKWAKSQGCRYVEGWVASPSRERLFSRFGYRPTYRILRKELP